MMLLSQALSPEAVDDLVSAAPTSEYRTPRAA
jgi:hypothetical protein